MESLNNAMLNKAKQCRKFNANLHQISQCAEDLKHAGKNAAFKEWLHKLGRKDTLPRGRFFRGKKAGKPIILIDECWQFNKKIIA